VDLHWSFVEQRQRVTIGHLFLEGVDICIVAFFFAPHQLFFLDFFFCVWLIRSTIKVATADWVRAKNGNESKKTSHADAKQNREKVIEKKEEANTLKMSANQRIGRPNLFLFRP